MLRIAVPLGRNIAENLKGVSGRCDFQKHDRESYFIFLSCDSNRAMWCAVRGTVLVPDNSSSLVCTVQSLCSSLEALEASFKVKCPKVPSVVLSTIWNAILAMRNRIVHIAISKPRPTIPYRAKRHESVVVAGFPGFLWLPYDRNVFPA